MQLFKDRMAETGNGKVVWEELQRKLGAMGLQVSLTSVCESLDGVEAFNAEQFRMPHLSKLIQGRLRICEARMLRPAATEIVPEPKKETNIILAASCAKKQISITA